MHLVFKSCLRPLLNIQGQTTCKVLLLKCGNIGLHSSRTMSTLEFETLKVTKPKEHVAQVKFNRPNKRNAMNRQFFRDMVECFTSLGNDTEIRSIVLSGSGKHFTAGLDLMDYAALFSQSVDSTDVARKAFAIRKMIPEMQNAISVIEECNQPVIAAVHSACIGGGIDVITACDMRFCSKDAYFQVKEVDVGLAADLGTLQRLPKIIGNHSLVRELCFTGRSLLADEASQCGLVSRVYQDRDALLEGAIALAEQIAEKSPVAVAGTKIQLNYARDHSVADGLNHVATWNMAMLQTEDLMIAAQASMSKSKATFSKL